MNNQSKLDQFRGDNPYDVETQAKRLLASKDDPLILYVLALGLAAAKQRQRHYERDHIKNIGEAPLRERIVPGRTTGSIKVVPIKPSTKLQNAMRAMILDVWHVNGEQKLGDATANDLAMAISREENSAKGHAKNAVFYEHLKKPLATGEVVRNRWNEKSVRNQIEGVYGEFRRSEAV